MSTPIKSGVQTSEFWLTVVTQIVGLLIQFNVFAADSSTAKVLAFAAMALSAMGYSYSRAMVKSATIQTPAIQS